MALIRRRRRMALAAVATTLTLGMIAAGCGSDSGGSTGSGGGDLSGKIAIDGSSTVGPLTSAVAEDFNGDNPGVDITVGTSGTGGGFEVFCKGETDISDASREIKDEEAKACADGGVEYEEFRVASDGITVVTKKGGAVGDDLNLTLDQLKAIWSKGSKVNNWSQIPGGGFPSAKLTLAGPDSQSGTYDFFNETVLGKDAAGEVLSPRQDYSASADDNVTVKAVTGSEQGLGYFGFSYYEENADTLDDIAVEGVKPSAETITDGSYPLSRPLYIYVSKASLKKPEVVAFVKYYIQNATSLAEELQFVPAPQDSLDADATKLAAYE
ncbi:MAG: phosphate ABC transporter substrate-binding protein PstS family protein [Thermoleophilia bacterium]